MKKLHAIIFSLALIPGLALAESKIAVINFMQAVGETEEVKKSSEELQADLQDETQKLQKLYDDISAIEQRMQKEGMTLSEMEKKDLQDKRQSKMIEFRSLQQMVQKRQQEGSQEIMKRMEPKLMEAVREVAQKEGYDVVIAKEAVPYSQPDMDITGKVTQKLNQMQ